MIFREVHRHYKKSIGSKCKLRIIRKANDLIEGYTCIALKNN